MANPAEDKLKSAIHNRVMGSRTLLDEYQVLGEPLVSRLSGDIIAEMRDPAINGLLHRIAAAQKIENGIIANYEKLGMAIKPTAKLIRTQEPQAYRVEDPEDNTREVYRLTDATLEGPKDTRSSRVPRENEDRHMSLPAEVFDRLRDAHDHREDTQRSVHQQVQWDMRSDKELGLANKHTVAAMAGIMIGIARNSPNLLPPLANQQEPEKTAVKAAPATVSTNSPPLPTPTAPPVHPARGPLATPQAPAAR